MSEILLDTDDLGEAEAVLTATYSQMRLGADPDPATRFRISQSGTARFAFRDLEYGADFRYDAEPMPSLVVCVTHSGGFDQQLSGAQAVVAGPGAVVAAGIHADVPFGGGVRAGRFSQLILDPDSLGEIVGTPGRDAAVRLTGMEPVSAEASDHLARLVGYVSDVGDSALTEQTPLLASEIRRHVAATVLATFPNTASFEATPGDRRDSTPENLRRAIAFIDDNAVRDISLADIAAAVYVTPRTLQYMFRKHRDSTPLEYLRRVRLHYAHLELLAADPLRATVSEIARKWGFGHVGRFAAFHRQHYGASPNRTLRDES